MIWLEYIPFVITGIIIGLGASVFLLILERQLRTAESRGYGAFWVVVIGFVTVCGLGAAYAYHMGYFSLHFIDHLLGMPRPDIAEANVQSMVPRISAFGGLLVSVLALLLTSVGKSIAWSMRSESPRTRSGLIKHYRMTDHLHFREMWLVSFGLLIFKNPFNFGVDTGVFEPGIVLRRVVAFPVMILLFFVGNEFDRWVPFGFRWQKALTVLANMLGIAMLTIVYCL